MATTTALSPAEDASVYQPLRITYGLVPLLAGLDKFFEVLADWDAYLAPQIASILPMEPSTFMGIVGIIEMAVGVLVLTRFTRIGAYIAAAWLVLIALQLILGGMLDIAVRDLAMAVGAYTLARLAEARAAHQVLVHDRSHAAAAGVPSRT